MAGIYVHIPFCKQACTYCDFHFSTNLSLQDQLTRAICDEIEQRKDELSLKPSTLYFGGGSPSILSDHNLELIVKQLSESFDLSELVETTIETNPDDHSSEKLAFWKSLGINRLSIGIQSFIERDLHWMNRAHNAVEANDCIEKAKEAGFNSLTIDLIYGIPGQSMQEWESNIEKAVAKEVNHISAYCLTVEEKTALAHQVDKGLVNEKTHEQVEAEFHLLQDTLSKAGFVQYELSNFAKKGNEALHNSNYWSGKPYLGIGPAAHSFDGRRTRRWNVSNNPKYIEAIESGQDYWEEEALKDVERINEQIMTGLRRRNGIMWSTIPRTHHRFIHQNINGLNKYWKEKLLVDEESIRMQPKHWMICDALVKELMIE